MSFFFYLLGLILLITLCELATIQNIFFNKYDQRISFDIFDLFNELNSNKTVNF